MVLMETYLKKTGTVQNGQDIPLIDAKKNATVCYRQWDAQRERGILNRKKNLTFLYFELTM